MMGGFKAEVIALGYICVTFKRIVMRKAGGFRGRCKGWNQKGENLLSYIKVSLR